MDQSLSAAGVSVSFEGLKALSNVTLDVPRERVTGLIGPNGAGKTTLVNVLTGFQKPTTGSVVLDGESIVGVPAHRVRQKGIARTFQSGRLFAYLSVLDNLEVTGVGLGLSRRDAAQKADEMLDWIGISHLAERMAGGLPYTDERRVAIGRALMLEPSYLLLDEPAAGMSAEEASELAKLIRRIIAEVKCGVLLIEHNIGLVLNICDHIHVLDSGEIIEVGPPALIKASEKVRHAYMGTQADAEGEVL
jgi:branched-chain amino acid transport system ATP-binding protein